MSQKPNPLALLRLVLVETKFPENIGSAARAAANFGPCELHLVRPERWRGEQDFSKAAALATSQGLPLLEAIQVHQSLPEVLGPCSLVLGSTARAGGWRRQLLTPRQAGAESATVLQDGDAVALVLGPEDRGLSNADLEHCNRLIHIPTNPEAKSLNLAQAALLLLYECRLAWPELSHSREPGPPSRRINQAEKEIFFQSFKQSLLDIDFLRQDNPDYFFLPLSRLFDRADLRRHEFDLLMGICRQIRSQLPKDKEQE